MRRSYHGSSLHLSGTKDRIWTPRERLVRCLMAPLVALFVLLGLLGPAPLAFAQEHDVPAEAGTPPVASTKPAGSSAGAAAALTGEVRLHESSVWVEIAQRT